MIDLTMPDTQESKFDLIFDLSEELDLLPPVYIISHKRSANLPTLSSIPALRSRATVVVAHSEEDDYRAALPDVDVAVIPEGFGGHDIGIGRAKQYCLEMADMLGQDTIVMLDDDLVRLSILFDKGEGKVSHAFKSFVGDRIDDYQSGLLVLMAALAQEAFDAHPEAIIASAQCNNSNRSIGSSEKRWELNRGGNPSQMTVWRVDRFTEMCGEMDLVDFNYHGEDIALVEQIIHAGGSVVHVPSIIGQYLDYETQSVMRTPDNAPTLRQEEHDSIMKRPLADFIKTRTDIIGRPQWHSMDWTALRRKGLVKDDIRLWTD